jgi:hypothetical protein
MGEKSLGALPAGRMVGPQQGSRSLSIPPDLEDVGADGKMQGVSRPSLQVVFLQKLTGPVRVVLGVRYESIMMMFDLRALGPT